MQTMITADQRTTGTPAYMAPEIILGERNVDRRADVYALGCVAYFLLTGQLVFEADTPMKMLLQHVQAEPVPPSQRTELPIPPEIDELRPVLPPEGSGQATSGRRSAAEDDVGLQDQRLLDLGSRESMVAQTLTGVDRPAVPGRSQADSGRPCSGDAVVPKRG